MSSKSVDKDVLEIYDNDDNIGEFFSLKDLVISFSDFFSSEKPQSIYLGKEKIPFEKRHPVYQMILRKEFAETIRNFMKKE